jgi:hypothetical protein
MWHATTSGPGGELAADGYRSTSAGKFPEPPIYAEGLAAGRYLDNARERDSPRSVLSCHRRRWDAFAGVWPDSIKMPA